MTRQFATMCGLALTLYGAEKALKMTDLPAPVQKAVEEHLKGGQLKGLSKEVEKGQTLYEAETISNGKTRDMLFDATGKLIEAEEEVSLSTIPEAARIAIEKKAAGGQITKVEALTKRGITTYEAAITKGRKKSEINVTADGAEVKQRNI